MSDAGNFFAAWIGFLLLLLVISIPAIIIVLIWVMLKYFGLSNGWSIFIFIVLSLIIVGAFWSQMKKLKNKCCNSKMYQDYQHHYKEYVDKIKIKYLVPEQPSC